jgi:hypothetical protein
MKGQGSRVRVQGSRFRENDFTLIFSPWPLEPFQAEKETITQSLSNATIMEKGKKS